MAFQPILAAIRSAVSTMTSSTLPSSASTPPSQSCALGLDFGNSKSKVTLAYATPECPHPVIKRVPFVGSMNDPERPDTSLQQDSVFDFVAFSALEDGRLVVGRQSLTRDCIIPLKTILLHFSRAASRPTVEGLPGGRELFRAWDAGLITKQMEEGVLVEHIELLYKHASLQARALRGGPRAIVDVVLTHPNYLFPAEGEHAFGVYVDCYTRLVRQVVGKKVNIRLVSEGQGTART